MGHLLKFRFHQFTVGTLKGYTQTLIHLMHFFALAPLTRLCFNPLIQNIAHRGSPTSLSAFLAYFGRGLAKTVTVICKIWPDPI